MVSAKIRVGDEVPSFSLKNQHGEEVKIETYFGKPFILYFYPKDGTPVCTAEACEFRNHYEAFRGLDAEVIGVSADPPATHLAFARAYDLPFLLLSDEKNEVQLK